MKAKVFRLSHDVVMCDVDRDVSTALGQLTSSKMVIFFVCFLLTSKVFWYHVTGHMQRAHCNIV